MADFNKTKPKSIITQMLDNKKTKSNTHFGNFKVSFQYVDTSQKYASSFKDWQKDGLLSKTLELLQGYCCRPLEEQIDGTKFTKYGNFPGPADIQIELNTPTARFHARGCAAS